MLNFFRKKDAILEGQKTANENDCPVALMYDTVTKWFYIEEDPDKLEIQSMELVEIIAPAEEKQNIPA